MMASTSRPGHDARDPRPVNLPELARSAPGRKPVWSHQGADLNLNLISCTTGQEIGSHVNTEVDVVLVGIEGTGSVEIDGRSHPFGPGHVFVIPKGSQRAMRCDSGQFAYLTCHQRRGGLMPMVTQSIDAG